VAATVLIADDDDDTRELYARYLAHHGLVVYGVGTGTDALRVIGETLPDVVLVDFRLPDMDGRDILRRLREGRETADLPIIALTGCATLADRERAHGLGCDAFLGKPCEPDSVLMAVMRVLADRQARRAQTP
jgi:CheY-like chemotaxis protein